MADYKLRTYVSDALKSTARGGCLNFVSLCLMTAVSGNFRLLRSCDEELMLSSPRTYKHYDSSEYAHRHLFRGISYDRVYRTVLDTEWRGHAPQVASDLHLGTLYLELEHKPLQWNEEIFGQVRPGVL